MAAAGLLQWRQSNLSISPVCVLVSASIRDGAQSRPSRAVTKRLRRCPVPTRGLLSNADRFMFQFRRCTAPRVSMQVHFI